MDRGERISAEDVGLPTGSALPFVFEPGEIRSPLVVSYPHVGMEWPDAAGPRPQVNFGRNADFAVHALYRGIPFASVRARYSRLLVDLNRADDDISADFVPDHPAPRPRLSPGSLEPAPEGTTNRGVVWRHAVGNIVIIRGTMPYRALEQRLDAYHRPYHRALEVLLERRRRAFGYAILVDAHSMPGAVGRDIVLGTLGGEACGPAVREAALDALRRPNRFDVRLDAPYRGGEIVRRFGRPAEGLHAFQVELSRALYMDEHRLELLPGAGTTLRDADAVERARAPVGAPARVVQRVRALQGALRSMLESLAVVRSALASSRHLAG